MKRMLILALAVASGLGIGALFSFSAVAQAPTPIPSVWLQTNSPGTTQTGNLNVSGTGILGALQVTGGAVSGYVLTSDADGNATWQPSSGGFSLPYDNSISIDAPAAAFKITNSGTGTAILGVTEADGGVAVKGEGLGTSGFTYGGHFTAASPDGRAVFGSNSATTGPALGGRFGTASTEGKAVYATAGAASGSSFGVWGESFSASGTGVFGSGGIGLDGTGILGVRGTGSTTGVVGIGNIAGGAFNANGVDSAGVSAVCAAVPGTGIGVAGYSYSENGTGLRGQATSTVGLTFGVTGYASATGYGMWSYGRFGASGTKSFTIDHPLDPENKYLSHYCTEGPEPLNVYRGTIVTDAKGYATVALPDYFDEINIQPTYQLTVVDDTDDFILAKVVKRSNSGGFVIRTSEPRTTVDWRVEALRNDRYVRAYGAPVEQLKPKEARGTYIQPELYGQPREKTQFYRPGPAEMAATGRKGSR